MVESTSKLETWSPVHKSTYRELCIFDVSVCSFWIFRLLCASLKEVLSAVVSSKLFRTFLFLPGCLAGLRLYWEARFIWEWLWTIFTVYNFRKTGTHWSQFFPGLFWSCFLSCLLLEITTFLHRKNFHLLLEQTFYCFTPS